jgi:hypothetical protein
MTLISIECGYHSSRHRPTASGCGVFVKRGVTFFGDGIIDNYVLTAGCQRLRAGAFAFFVGDVTFAVGTITLCTGITIGCPGSIPSC